MEAPRFVVDRKFWVREGKQAEFEVVFEPHGIWSRFLRQSEGYIATEVKCESVSDGRYRVRDFWSGHRGFESFRERFAEFSGRLDRMIAEELVEKQEFVGAYYEADGHDLVPA
jgi:hypothetical protein